MWSHPEHWQTEKKDPELVNDSMVESGDIQKEKLHTEVTPVKMTALTSHMYSIMGERSRPRACVCVCVLEIWTYTKGEGSRTLELHQSF